MRFEIRTKRRVYYIYVEFHEDQYELDLIGVFGKRRKTIGGWEQIQITVNPLDFAKTEIKKFELKEDYIDELNDKAFYLDSEAEEAATALQIEEHEIKVSDWLTGTQGTLRITQKKSSANSA